MKKFFYLFLRTFQHKENRRMDAPSLKRKHNPILGILNFKNFHIVMKTLKLDFQVKKSKRDFRITMKSSKVEISILHNLRMVSRNVRQMNID